MFVAERNSSVDSSVTDLILIPDNCIILLPDCQIKSNQIMQYCSTAYVVQEAHQNAAYLHKTHVIMPGVNCRTNLPLNG
jgi:hypothetical protein